jgi:hypothetical protein
MRSLIATVSLAAFVSALAQADESYAPPGIVQTEPAESGQPSAQASESEETESAQSAAAGDGGEPDGENAGQEEAAAEPRELDV